MIGLKRIIVIISVIIIAVSIFVAGFFLGIYVYENDQSYICNHNFYDYDKDDDAINVDKSGHAEIAEFELIEQLPELPTGCEVTSLSMVLNYYGYDIDKLELARNYLDKEELYRDENEILYGPDFMYVFPGDPENDTSFGCFAPCIENTAKKYLDDIDSDYIVSDITGTSFYDLFSYISDGIPVIIWSTMKLKSPEYITSWITEDKYRVVWPTNEHCVVLSAYDYSDNTVRLHDPVEGVVTMNMEKVKKRYDQLGKNAVIIYKKV